VRGVNTRRYSAARFIWPPPLTEHPGALAVVFIAILLRSELAKIGVVMMNVFNLNPNRPTNTLAVIMCAR
jgi:hypothetical protein